MAAHAWANELSVGEGVGLPAIDERTFLARFMEQLGRIQSLGHLYPYQRRILEEIRRSLSEHGRFVGHVTMATGTGKTYVQVILALAALLTGTRRRITIVAPYRSLVEQTYSTFLSVLEQLDGVEGVSASQIIKVSSAETSVHAETLLSNSTLDDVPCVLICCEDSYAKLLGPHPSAPDARLAPYARPGLVVWDESCLVDAALTQFMGLGPLADDCIVVGFSATPKRGRSWPVSIAYSRSDALREGYLAPCVLDRFNVDYCEHAVLQLIELIPRWLSGAALPNGGRLADTQGIIYVPNTAGDTNYSRMLKAQLDAAGIRSIEINSDERDATALLMEYKSGTAKANILICKGMARVGFSVNTVRWIIYLQNGSQDDFYQAAGRAMRKYEEDEAKVAYLLGFRNVNAKSVFVSQIENLDEEALPRCSSSYLSVRKSGGEIAILPVARGIKRAAESVAENAPDFDEGVTPAAKRHGFFQSTARGIKRKTAQMDSIKDDVAIEMDRWEQIVCSHVASVDSEVGGFPFGMLQRFIGGLLALEHREENVALLKEALTRIYYPLRGRHPKLGAAIQNIEDHIEGTNSAWIIPAIPA